MTIHRQTSFKKKIVPLFLALAAAEFVFVFYYLRYGNETAALVSVIALTAAIIGCALFFIQRYASYPDKLSQMIHSLMSEQCGEFAQVHPAGTGSDVLCLSCALISAVKTRDSELHELSERLCEIERLAGLGKLSAGVAHELNNPLGGIIVYSHLLLEDTPADDPRYSNISKIIKEANRCKIIIKGLLDYARQSQPVFSAVNVKEIVSEALNNLRREPFFENIAIDVNFDDDLRSASADASQIQEVFENIIRNAAEVMEGGGALTIHCINSNGNTDGDFVEVVFEDTGSGIPDDVIEHIFDPFYTTKSKSHGSGLGLAVSYGIMERHKGSIAVTNRDEGGAAFSVKLKSISESTLSK